MNIIQLLGISAGFLVILAATVLAFRQNLTFAHVAVFAMGCVLAGISGISFNARDGSFIVSQVASASVSQVEALAKLGDELHTLSNSSSASLIAINDRVDKLSGAIEEMQKVNTAAGSEKSTEEISRNLKLDNKSSIKIDKDIGDWRLGIQTTKPKFDALVKNARDLSGQAKAASMSKLQ